MRITIDFDLDEDVTPTYFASRVAVALARGTLRVGESLVCDGTRFTVTEPVPLELGKETLMVPNAVAGPA